MNIEDYKQLIKKERLKHFDTPYDMIYQALEQLGYHKKDVSFFVDNASNIVEKLRQEAWGNFLPIEKDFTVTTLKRLVSEEQVSKLTGLDAIGWFVENFPEHIYTLTLSNTQSRRSRAGTEFETIIELILMGANIPMDTQGNIGKTAFASKGLGKAVDIVSPGAYQYLLNKRNTVLISAKTTLRERWQQVPEEMGRTGAREMFLATLDTGISNEAIDILYEANIQLVTTQRNKAENYAHQRSVLSFEELLDILQRNALQWAKYSFTEQDKEHIFENLDTQLATHEKHNFVKNYYEAQKLNFGEANARK